MARDLYFYDREFDVDVYVCPMVGFLRGFDPSVDNEDSVAFYLDMDKTHEEYEFYKKIIAIGRFADFTDRKKKASRQLTRFMKSIFQRPHDFADLGYTPGKLLENSVLPLQPSDEEYVICSRGEEFYGSLNYWCDILNLYEENPDEDGVRQLKNGVGIAYHFNCWNNLWTPKKLVAA